MCLEDKYLIADEIYRAGYKDGIMEKDYDPRNSEEWQVVVDALNEIDEYGEEFK